MSETTTEASPTTDNTPKPQRAKRAKRPKRARSSAPTVAPDATADEGARSDFAARFRSAGTTTGHTCPKGHGPTEPVEPGHTWCATCGRHWTVIPATA